MKKLVCYLIILIMLVSTCSCNNFLNVKSKTYTLKNYIEKSYDDPLIFYHVDECSKDEKPMGIFIFKNGYVKSFLNYDGLTLADFSSMSDKEIISKFENNWEEENKNFIDLAKCYIPNYLKNGSATIYKKEYLPYYLSIDTDDSGNNVEYETLYLPTCREFNATHCLWYDGWARDAYLNETYFNTGYGIESDIKQLCEPFAIVYSSTISEIYDSRYLVLNCKNTSYTNDGHLLTRVNKDITIKYDKLTEESIFVDPTDDTLESIANRFYNHYLNNFKRIEEFSTNQD